MSYSIQLRAQKILVFIYLNVSIYTRKFLCVISKYKLKKSCLC